MRQLQVFFLGACAHCSAVAYASDGLMGDPVTVRGPVLTMDKSSWLGGGGGVGGLVWGGVALAGIGVWFVVGGGWGAGGFGGVEGLGWGGLGWRGWVGGFGVGWLGWSWEVVLFLGCLGVWDVGLRLCSGSPSREVVLFSGRLGVWDVGFELMLRRSKRAGLGVCDFGFELTLRTLTPKP